MTLEEGKKLASILEDFVNDDFHYEISKRLRDTFPELNWITQQQCPPIFWVAEHDS